MQYNLLQTVTDFEIVLFILLRMASACEHTEYSQPDLASTLPYLYRSTSPFDVSKKDWTLAAYLRRCVFRLMAGLVQF